MKWITEADPGLVRDVIIDGRPSPPHLDPETWAFLRDRGVDLRGVVRLPREGEGLSP